MKKALLPALLLGLGAAPAAGAADADEAALRRFVERETASLKGRVQVTLGDAAAHVRSAPCAKVQPYLVPGTRLWGKTALGIRCAEGKPWSGFVPVEVRVYAPAWIAARALPAGQPVAAGDAREEEVDLTRQPAGLLSGPLPPDKVLARTIAPGQVLRQDAFRAPAAFRAGDPVKVVYAGQGFSVSTTGRALNPAATGEPARVQTESGRIVAGVARGPAEIEIRP